MIAKRTPRRAFFGRQLARVLAGTAGVLLVGCSALSYQIDPEVLRDLGTTHRMLLFEAEGDLVSVQVARQQFLNAWQIHRNLLSKVRLEVEQTAARIDREQDDPGKEQRLTPVIFHVQQKRQTYLEAKDILLESELSLYDSAIVIEEARLELARAKLLLKYNVLTPDDIDIADYETQVEDLQSTRRQEDAKLEVMRQYVADLQTAWRRSRQELYKNSGGTLGSPWFEDVRIPGG